MEQGATVKAQEGIWTLTAPDGREWKAESPLRAVAQESWERIPPTVALERIYAAAAEVPMPPWEDEANALIDALLDAARTDGMLRQIKLVPVARDNLLEFVSERLSAAQNEAYAEGRTDEQEERSSQMDEPK
jgi:hypothetical protein